MFNWRPYCPSFFEVVRKGYSRSSFFADLMAGLTVGIISLPLGMAIAIGSGVEPARGLFTSIIAGFLVALLGGSRFQIAGPTGAFVVLVFDIVQRQGYEGLALATLLAGGLIVLMGVFKAGSFLKFIPFPVIIGLTTGIAVTLFSSQIKDLFELKVAHPSVDFLENWQLYWEALPTTNLTALAVGLASIIAIIWIQRVNPKIPAPVVIVIGATLLVWLFDLPIETIEKRFGFIPNTLPTPGLPEFSLARLREIAPDAISVAILAGLESLLSAAVADGLTGTRHRSNCELVAQGIANVGSALFGGIPATGAMARTVTNVRLGAQSSLSAMVYSVVILVVLLLFSTAASKIPLSVLSAVLIVISLHMADLSCFWSLLRSSKTDITLCLSTFFLTILLDITIAVQVGVILAALFFMKKMAETTQLRFLKKVVDEDLHPTVHGHLAQLPPHVEWLEVQGPLFFGASDLFNEFFAQTDAETRVVILSLAAVPLIDSTGIEMIIQLVEQCEKRGWELVLVELTPQVKERMRKSPLSEKINPQRVFDSLQEALAAL